MLIKITQKQKNSLKKIAKKFGLDLILVFGSRVQDKVHPLSDLDIAVSSKKLDFTLKQYSDLLFQLEKVFPQKVDLVFINKADPLLLHEIVQSNQLLYGTKRQFLEFKIYAYKRYQDYKPYFKMEEKFVNKFIKELAYGH